MKINLQNAASPLIEQLNFFHDWVMRFVAAIALAVLWFLYLLITSSLTFRWFTDSQNVEFIWTALPCVVLIGIAFPSLRLLYMIDEVGEPGVTLKAVGHQWYWSYEYSDFNDSEFDAYMTKSPYRLLDCDHRILIPTETSIRVLITAADVLHSWTIPAMGVKADAVPGRLNQVRFFCDRAGVYFGQCREICGSNHRFMPIAVETLPSAKFAEVFKEIV